MRQEEIKRIRNIIKNIIATEYVCGEDIAKRFNEDPLVVGLISRGKYKKIDTDDFEYIKPLLQTFYTIHFFINDDVQFKMDEHLFTGSFICGKDTYIDCDNEFDFKISMLIRAVSLLEIFKRKIKYSDLIAKTGDLKQEK